MTAFLNMMKLIVSLLPAVASAIQQVEALFPSGAGAAKLALIKNLVVSAYNAAPAAEHTIQQIIIAVEWIAQHLVATFNAIGLFKKSEGGAGSVTVTITPAG